MNRFGYLMIVSACIAACSKPTIEIPEVDTSELYEAPVKAIENSLANVQDEPSSAPAWGKYAMTLHAHEFHETAIDCYFVASQLHAGEEKWQYLRGMLVQTSDPELAFRIFNKLSDSQSEKSALYLLRKAQVAQRLGDTQAATEIYRQLLNVPEYSDYARIEIARRQFQNGKLVDANQTLDDVSETGQKVAEYKKLRGQLLSRTEVSERGRQMVEASDLAPSVESLIVDPFLESVQRVRRDPFYMARRLAEAALAGDAFSFERLRRLLEDHPELVEIRVQYLRCLLEFQMFEETDSIIEEGLALYPKQIDLLRMQSASMILQKKWETAKQTLNRILEMEPKSRGAMKDLEYVESQLQ